MTPEQAADLRAPFAPEQIGKLPKGGAMLDFVGHAAVCDRLLKVDAAWCWEPDRTPDGRWDIQTIGKDATLTGTLTVCGVTRPCVGTAQASAFELAKQLQSDAIRNGAMRFGVALDLWSKEDLHAEPPPPVFDPAVPNTWPDALSIKQAKAVVLCAAHNDRDLALAAWDELDIDGHMVDAAWLDDRVDMALENAVAVAAVVAPSDLEGTPE